MFADLAKKFLVIHELKKTPTKRFGRGCLKFRYNEKFFGKVGEQKSRFLHEKSFFSSRFFLAPVYVRGASFPAVSRHFGHPQKKQYQKKFTDPPLMQYLKQPPSYMIKLIVVILFHANNLTKAMRTCGGYFLCYCWYPRNRCSEIIGLQKKNPRKCQKYDKTDSCDFVSR